ncbi:MAG TPA: MgtC/SapB family protein [Bryobacteraceae bacterium]|jgi:putative Mg2+ transporter-C (MgtC) family protein|nr:MgtC/SapB family protein [Bryobacteraceae bacterium]
MPNFEWSLFWVIAGKIVAAYILAMPTGWVREQQAHGVGIRTFPIVAVASCGYLLIMQGLGSGSDAIAANSRVLQGLVAGIGFVGGGAILKEGMSVHGTATAASIWNTGAIGAAAAMGRFEIAVVLAVLNVLTMRALVPLKKRLDTASEAESVDQKVGGKKTAHK